MNWDRIEREEVTHRSPDPDSAIGVPGWRIHEQQSVTGTNVGEEPGLMANNQITTTYQMGGAGVQEAQARRTEEQFIYDTVHEFIESNIGEVMLDASSLTVMAVRHRHYFQEHMQANGQLDGTTWEEFVAETSLIETPIPVDPNLVEAIRIATGLGPAQLAIVGYEVPMFHSYDETPINWRDFILFGILTLLILLLALGMLRRSQIDEIIELEPELTVEDLLVSTQLEEEKEDRQIYRRAPGRGGGASTQLAERRLGVMIYAGIAVVRS
jgi:flagellar M-ring protein FliF